MGNLMACCPAPKRGSSSETRSGKTLMEHWLCDGYQPLQLSPSTFHVTATLAISPCGGCDVSNSAPELRSKIERASLNNERELKFDNPELLQNLSYLKQQNFGNPSKKKKVTFDPNVIAFEASSPLLENKVGDCEKAIKGKVVQIADKIPAYPSDQKFQKQDTFYSSSYQENYHDGSGGYHHEEEEESSDSLFSLQLDKDWQTFSEVDSAKSKPTSSSDEKNALISSNLSGCDKNVLKSVENFSLQLRQVKEKKESAARLLDKENIDQSHGETQVLGGVGKSTNRSADSSCDSYVCKGDEICMEASFSSWLQMPHENYGSCTSSIPDGHPISSAMTADKVEIWRLQSNTNLPGRYLEHANQMRKLNFSTSGGRSSNYGKKDKIINRHSIHSI